MNIPTSSLIVSTYNWPEALALCLKGILAQTVLPGEVIIADDGSGPDTKKVIEEFLKITPIPIIHVWHTDNGFQAGAIRNKAIVKASGDYIIQIDGDIIPHCCFVEDHLDFACRGFFTAGSRILLTPILTKRILHKQRTKIFFWRPDMLDHLNGLRNKTLRNYLRHRYKINDLYHCRGCNVAFWKEDLLKVNGYNEDMTGWGREDSELTARLLSLGLKKQTLKFGGIAYHLYHRIRCRNRVSINTHILQETIRTKATYTKNGIIRAI